MGLDSYLSSLCSINTSANHAPVVVAGKSPVPDRIEEEVTKLTRSQLHNTGSLMIAYM